MKKLFLLLLLVSTKSIFAQWNLVNADSTVAVTSEIQFVNKDTGYVSGGLANHIGYFLKTIDGGNTWQRSDTINGFIRAFHFVNDTLGYSGGNDGRANKTVDGGNNWTQITSTNFLLEDYGDMHFFNELEGIAINHNIYKTVDGGVNWVILGQNNKNFDSFRDGFFLVDSVGYAYTGELLKTYDNADTWDTVNSPIINNNYLGAIYFLTEERGFLAGEDGLFAETYDGGNSWGYKNFTNNSINEIVFINDSVGFCSTENYISHGNYSSDLFYTLNGGITWNETTCPDYISKMYVLNDSTIITSGSFGKIYKFSNPLDYVTSIKENKAEQLEIIVYPNPANDIVNFELPQKSNRKFKLKLYSIDGKLIKETEIKNSYKLDLSEINSGVYIYKIQDKFNSTVGKILKH